MNLSLYGMAYPVTALGPGRRLALWVAGCNLRCQGCITPELWDSQAGKQVSVEKVVRRILRVSHELDGITLTGGEPFEQATPLAELVERLRLYRSSWNFIAYTGYTLKSLIKKGGDAERLLAATDILVDGPYSTRDPPSHPIAGSGNQVIHYLTEQGMRLRNDVNRLQWDRANLALGADGQALLVGIVQKELRREIHDAMGLNKVIDARSTGTFTHVD